MSLLAAVETTVVALGIDPADQGEHAGLVALCRLLAGRIDLDEAGQDGPTELRRALNDLRRQVKESGDADYGTGVLEQLRAI